jgi:hypothetical protein
LRDIDDTGVSGGSAGLDWLIPKATGIRYLLLEIRRWTNSAEAKSRKQKAPGRGATARANVFGAPSVALARSSTERAAA